MTSAGPGPVTIDELLSANRRWQQTFDKPMDLGVRKKVSIVTCMDSRLVLSKMLDLDVGDAEMIRNAGGRVTLDVVRSLLVAQEIPELSTRLVLIIHHTDCGAQAAVRHHHLLMEKVNYYMTHTILPIRLLWSVLWFSSYLIPGFIKEPITDFVTGRFRDPVESVIRDVKILRSFPIMPRDIPIYGAVYDVHTGALKLAYESAGIGAPSSAYASKKSGAGQYY
eukprot:jgi/Chrzof1/8077/UNPLg00122.t1